MSKKGGDKYPRFFVYIKPVLLLQYILFVIFLYDTISNGSKDKNKFVVDVWCRP